MDEKSCAICDHEGLDVEQYGDEDTPKNGRMKMLMCSFCASTMVGNVHRYSVYSADLRMTARMIAELYWKLREGK